MHSHFMGSFYWNTAAAKKFDIVTNIYTVPGHYFTESLMEVVKIALSHQHVKSDGTYS